MSIDSDPITDTDEPVSWPRTVPEAAAFLQEGEVARWFAELPDGVKRTGAWNCVQLYRRFHENSLIARHLEERRDELEALYARLSHDLAARGLLFEDLVVLDRMSRGAAPFGFSQPDYVLPRGHRRADLENDKGAAPG